MAEGRSIEDTLMPDATDDVTKSQAARQAMIAMWDAVENAVDAVVKRNEGHDKEKIAHLAAVDVCKVAKRAALHKVEKIINEEKKEKFKNLQKNLQSEPGKPTDEEGIKQKKIETEPVPRSECAEQLSPTVLVAKPWNSLRTLGRGAYGLVTLAEDKNGLKFAAKEVQKRDTRQLESLQDEIYCLMKLNHENIVKCYGYQNDEDKLYMFIELMEGSVKDKMVNEEKAIDMHIARKFTKHLLNGLMYLHSRGVVHRDIKCANLLLDRHDRVKLADMGISKVHVDIKAMIELTKTKGAVNRAGSYFWMSPEVILGQEGKRRADIWSVGCTVYEMAIQQAPFGDLEGNMILYELYQKIERMEHRTLVLSHEYLDYKLKEFLLSIFVEKNKRPLTEKLSTHPWLS